MNAAAFDEAVSRHRQGRLSEAASLYQAVLKRDQKHFGALHGLGLISAAQGRHEDSVRLIRKALNQNPNSAEAQCDLGNALLALGRLEDAVARYGKALALRPDFAEAHNNLGNTLQAQRRHDDAIGCYERALAVAPGFATAHHNLANSLSALGRIDEAIAQYQTVIALEPDSAAAHYNFGSTLLGAKRHEAALALFVAALVLRPDYPEAHNNLGNVLQALDRHDEAAAHYEAALALSPRFALAHSNLGNSLRALHRLDEAVGHYETALALAPDYAEAHYNMGNALCDLRRHDAAIAHYEAALAIALDYAEPHNGLGNALQALGRGEAAVEHYKRALAIDPRWAVAHFNLGVALDRLQRFEEAAASQRCAVALDPGDGAARSALTMLSQRMCCWGDYTENRKALVASVDGGASAVLPFVFFATVDDPARQLRCARRYIESRKLQQLPAVWDGSVYAHDKIRLAYLSADFRSHPIAFFAAELFERHDRERFEVTAFSWGADDGSLIRRRLERSFDRFLDVGAQSDLELARQIRAHEIDIVVDLTGAAINQRLAALAYRAAPIQVGYLATATTMGADFIDYIIVDPFVVPADQQPNFTERLVHLPDCYQVNDSTRPIAEDPPSRAESGLPEDGFVFACFNNTYKITPGIFDIWMRLLHAVPGSVLWLLGDNSWAVDNLRREAAARSVSPDRLVFAGRCPPAQHLARHRLADLFLDTRPYNAHTTASDALWAGLPMVTCSGRSFAARVAGSLLRAVGLPELVTSDLEHYEALALDLARTPAMLHEIRRRLAENRSSAPLFDTDRFRRSIEDAYRQMWGIWQCGERPRPLAVMPQPLDRFVTRG